jgi:dUTP pyrophosphatase
MAGEDIVDMEVLELDPALVEAPRLGPVMVEVLKLDPDLDLPAYARPGDAGADLRARADVSIPPGGGRALVPTGIAIAIPEGYAGFVQPRSGLALRHGVTVLNAPGLIDAGYRDELMVLLVNTDPVTGYQVRRGDRVAQLVIKAVAQAEFVAVAELSASERGLGGFGHSGREGGGAGACPSCLKSRPWPCSSQSRPAAPRSSAPSWGRSRP